MPGPTAARPHRARPGSRASRCAARPEPGSAEREAAAWQLPLVPLGQALAEGTAMFGTSPVTGLGEEAAPLTRLQGRLGAIYRDLPDAGVGAGGVLHAASGMAFAELTVGAGRYLVGCGKARHGRLAPGPPVDIVTGLCMFGADSVTGLAGGHVHSLTDPQAVSDYAGRAFDRVSVDERVHVYEAEAAARLGAFIGDLAAQVAPSPVRVHAHIPVPEYQLHALSLYARAYLTAAQCDQYRLAARRRGRLIGELLRACVGGAADVLASSPLDWLAGVDPYRVPRGRLAQMLHREARRQGGLWQVLLADADSRSFRALSRASYVRHYLAAAQRSQRGGGQLAVVENPDEEIIYRRAAALQERTGIALADAAGCYVHPRAVVRETVLGLRPLLYNCREGRSPCVVRAAVASLGFLPGGGYPGGLAAACRDGPVPLRRPG